jgi:hypothetical protein
MRCFAVGLKLPPQNINRFLLAKAASIVSHRDYRAEEGVSLRLFLLSCQLDREFEGGRWASACRFLGILSIAPLCLGFDVFHQTCDGRGAWLRYSVENGRVATAYCTMKRTLAVVIDVLPI